MASPSQTLPSPPSSSGSDTSSAAPLNLQEDQEWQDVEADTEDLSFKGFFSDQTFPTIEGLLENAKQEHNLDFVQLVKSFDLDFYGAIKLVNYLRSEAKSGNTNPDVTRKDAFEDDKYLQPVLEDDALLFSLDDVIETWKTEEPSSRVSELEEQLARLQLQLAKVIDDRWSENGPTDEPAESSSRSVPTASPARPSAASGVRKPFQDNDTYYFDSYAYNDIHETMLKDAVRTDAYRDFIYCHKPLFQGKTVLDVGCGTGILSMFAAKAGASRVFAVDNSSIAEKARQNIKANSLDSVITVFKGKIEDISLPLAPGEKVDVLVSEWMGYALLYEAMLPSILFARTAYLNSSTGILAPSHMTLRIAPVADPEWIADTVTFWNDVYGFDMRAMTDKMHDEVIVRSPKMQELAGHGVTFRELDLYKVGNADLDFANVPFSLVLERDIDALDAFVIWFDTFFLPQRISELPRGSGEAIIAEDFKQKHKPEESSGVAFTTGPGGPRTHWEAAVLVVDRTKGHGARSANQLPLKKGTVITGSVGYARRQDNERQLDIKVAWAVEGGEERGEQTWSLK